MRRILVFVGALALPVLAEAEVACLAGEAPGVDPADVETVAQIVCSQLRRQGEQVRKASVAQGEHWRVSLRPLGRKVLLSLQHVGENGAVRREGELMLNEIEETPVGAQRLVAAVLEGRDVSSTATVDTLIGDEVRQRKKKDGEHFFGIGLMGLAVPGTDMVAGGGLILRWSFETTRLGVVADLRFAGGSPADDEASFVSIGVGGRWFASSGSWSPFLGTGLSFSGFDVREKGEFSGGQSGLGAWVEIGAEILRLYDSRLSLELRAEPVFYELQASWKGLEADGRKYYLPLTFGLTYMF